MKTCSFCGSTAFDDMEVCYECLQPFSEEEVAPSGFAVFPEDDPDDLQVEEPSELALKLSETKTADHIHIQVSESLGYDIYPSRKGVTIELVNG